jgi:tetratricopeptide (TPR) repeat protein
MTQNIPAFSDSISTDTPILKLIKYLSLISMDNNSAMQFWPDMSKIALDNKLVVVFREAAEKLNLKDYQNDPNFKRLRSDMVNETNSLHSELKRSTAENNNYKTGEVLLELGNIYFKYGDFKEASNYLGRLVGHQGCDKVTYENYAVNLALSYYYLDESYNLLSFSNQPIDKTILKKYP